ncbi:MAG TPA: GNAT family N-acetyltransferase [Candidatus Angelobacter sp.]
MLQAGLVDFASFPQPQQASGAAAGASACQVIDMKFTVRQGRIEDANSIAFVQVESWKTTYAGIVPDDYLASLNPEVRTERWREQFSAGMTLFLVAEDESGVFGFASGGKLRDAIAGYDAELYAIYLLHQKQKQGVGKMLVRKLAEGLRSKGFQNLLVWVLAKNPAVGFYERLGGSAVAQKEIEIGGAQLTEIALGWANLDNLL